MYTFQVAHNVLEQFVRTEFEIVTSHFEWVLEHKSPWMSNDMDGFQYLHS